MIISVTSLKGGVGKSTISQNLAVCFAHMGYRVAIVDTDTNASSVHWSGIREEEYPHITVMGIGTSDALRKNIKQLEKYYDIIVIDGTPSLSKLVSTIIILGDIVLIPIRPSGLDIWATEKFIEKYDQAKALKEDVKAFFILNEFLPIVSMWSCNPSSSTSSHLLILAIVPTSFGEFHPFTELCSSIKQTPN